MLLRKETFLTAILLLAAPLLQAKATESSIGNELGKFREIPSAQRGAEAVKIAADIRTLPAGLPKLKLADGLVHLVTEGDLGKEAIQAAADALAEALTGNPLPAKNDNVPMPYSDLASLVRYEHVTTSLNDPLYIRASQQLADQEKEIEKADFTLKDMKGKKVTLSELRGKIVLVNFWATWCAPCRNEMAALDSIYTHLESHGLVVLSITNEEPFKVASFLGASHYHPPVLLDPGGKTASLYHITGIPKSFVFNREGKLTGVAIDERTGQQFLRMLQDAGLQ